jgi:hypothetical protein
MSRRFAFSATCAGAIALEIVTPIAAPTPSSFGDMCAAREPDHNFRER